VTEARVSLAQESSQMATIRWKSGVSADWADAADWNGRIVPVSGDTAVFGSTETYGVTIDSAEAVQSLRVDDADATVTLNNTLTVVGTLDVVKGTFDLDGMETPAGTINGGTLSATGGQFVWNYGTLSRVTYDGVLSVAAGQSLVVTNGIAVTGADGEGPGVIDLAGSLDMPAGQTLDDMTINMGGSGGPSAIVNTQGNSLPIYLTFGTGFTLNVVGPQASLAAAFGGFINDGSIVVGNGGNLDVQTGAVYDRVESVENDGTMTVDSGGVLTVGPRQLSNFPDTTLIGGTFVVNGGSQAADMILQNEGTRIQIGAVDATVILNGANSVLETQSVLTDAFTTIDQSLKTIAGPGVLEILGGRDFDSTQAFSNRGALDLGGGTFTEASLANSGTINGFGVIDAPVNNTKTISAAGGVLEVDGTVTGAGRFDIGVGSELRLDQAATAVTATFAGADGTLAMADPDAFNGKIAGFAAGDTIDLVGLVATSVTRTRGTDILVFSNDGATVAALTLTGDYLGDTFHVASDGAGGTNVTLIVPAAPALARLAQAMAAITPTEAAGAAHVTDTLAGDRTAMLLAPAIGRP
jgi:hypothetical protein